MPGLRAVAVAAVAVVCLAGCGKDADPAPQSRPEITESPVATEPEPTDTPTPAAPPKACDLVTKLEVESVAGTRVNKPIESPESCMWSAPVTGPTAQVEVYTGDGAKKILDIDRDLDHEFEPVPRLGDEAFLEEGAVFFSKGGQWVAIRVVRLDDPAVYRKALLALARAVAEKL